VTIVTIFYRNYTGYTLSDKTPLLTVLLLIRTRYCEREVASWCAPVPDAMFTTGYSDPSCEFVHRLSPASGWRANAYVARVTDGDDGDRSDRDRPAHDPAQDARADPPDPARAQAEY